MERITIANLEALTTRINTVTGSPEQAWTRRNGKLQANVGNYHIDSAYGGWKLHRMVNKGGGVQDVLSHGYTTKRDLFNLLHAFINGIYTAKQPELRK